MLLNDEQYTSSIVLNAVKEILKIKRNLIKQLDEKTIYLYLDELIYKMATTEVSEAGLYTKIANHYSFDSILIIKVYFSVLKSNFSIIDNNVSNGTKFNKAHYT